MLKTKRQTEKGQTDRQTDTKTDIDRDKEIENTETKRATIRK